MLAHVVTKRYWNILQSLTVQLTADKMKVTPEEIEAGYTNLDKETREAIEYAYKNIYDFHEKQPPRKCGLLWSMTDLW